MALSFAIQDDVAVRKMEEIDSTFLATKRVLGVSCHANVGVRIMEGNDIDCFCQHVLDGCGDRVTSKGSAPELVKRETDTRVTCTVDALKHSETLYAITMRYMLRMEITNLGNSPTANIRGKGDKSGKSYRIDDRIVQYQRQRDDNDLQDERQYQPNEEKIQASGIGHNGQRYEGTDKFCVLLEELRRQGKFVRSGCTTALNVVPWETDGESVLREACPTRASFYDLLLLSLFIVHSVCLLLLPHSVHGLMCHGRAVYNNDKQVFSSRGDHTTFAGSGVVLGGDLYKATL
ncbi:hypothetical protein Tco_0605811 [Tanacetum coccineum]